MTLAVFIRVLVAIIGFSSTNGELRRFDKDSNMTLRSVNASDTGSSDLNGQNKGTFCVAYSFYC